MAFCRVLFRRAQHAILHRFESGFGKGPRIAQFGVSKKRRAGVALCDIWTRMGFSRMHAGAALPGEAERGALLARSWRWWGAASRRGMEWPLRRSYRQAGAVVSRAGARNCTGGLWRGSGCRARVRVEGCVVGSFFVFGLGSTVWGLQSLAFWSSQGRGREL